MRKQNGLVIRQPDAASSIGDNQLAVIESNQMIDEMNEDGFKTVDDGQSLPENVLLKPKLDRIFADVETSLPAIDFDMSDVSSEDDVPIFTRTLKTPPLDLSSAEHCLETDDMDALDISASPVRTKSMRLSRLYEPAWSVHAGGDLDLNIDVSAALSSAAETMLSELNSTSDRNAILIDDFNSLSELVKSKPAGKMDNLGQNGYRAIRETAVGKLPASKLQKAPSTSMQEKSKRLVSMFLPDQPLKLLADDAFAALSHDIDQLSTATVSLDELKLTLDSEDEMGWSSEPYSGHVEYDSRVDKDEVPLLERLAQFSMRQSETDCLADIDCRTGALGNKAASQFHRCDERGAGDQPRESFGAPAHSAGRQLPPLPPRRADRGQDTVVLDLRQHDDRKRQQIRSVEKVKKVLGLSTVFSASSSDDDDGADDRNPSELWFEQRRRIKESLQAGQAVQPDPVRKRSSASSKSLVRPKTHAQRLAGHITTKRTESGADDSISAADGKILSAPSISKTASSALPQTSERNRSKCHSAASGDKSSIAVERKVSTEGDKEQKKHDESRKLHEQRLEERKSRIRIGETLESLRPKRSLKGRSPCADATPVIFDIDVSYEPEPKPLPSYLSSYPECILLTIPLSSCGHIAGNAIGSKSIDPGTKVSASYVMLVSWLLSRVVPSLNDDAVMADMTSSVRNEVTGSVPFHVVGLQQLVLDGQLALHVAIVPVRQFTARDLPTKSKKDLAKELSPFQKIVTKFLSSNSLQSVCPWLADIVPQEVRPAVAWPQGSTSADATSAAADQRRPSTVYRPSLFTVTDRPLSTFIQLNPDPRAVTRIQMAPIGFFWETVELADEVYLQCDGDCGDDDDREKATTMTSSSASNDGDLQSTMSLIYEQVFYNPQAMMAILTRVLQDGLTVCGLRLLYPTGEQMEIGSKTVPVENASRDVPTPAAANAADLSSTVGPVLAIALRGAGARTVWLDAVGPSDPVLARRTDPMSLCALYGGESREGCLIFCPRNPYRTAPEIVRWFGGRVPASGIIRVGGELDGGSTGEKSHAQKNKKSKSSVLDLETPTPKPAATMAAMTTSDIFLAISPLVPTKCFGLVLMVCQRRGYRLKGVRRLHLSARRASQLGIPVPDSGSVFVPVSSSVKSASEKLQPHAASGRPTTILLLTREDARNCAASLVEGIMIQLVLIDVLGEIQRTYPEPISSDLLFHFTPFCGTVLLALGGDFASIPSVRPMFTSEDIPHPLYSNPELEQVVVLALCGRHSSTKSGSFLANLLGLMPYNRRTLTGPLGNTGSTNDGFEVLGMKWLPRIGLESAKCLTPYEVGDRSWKASVRTLASEPALLLVLRGVNAFARLDVAVHPQGPSSPRSLDQVMSPTPELAFRLASTFFNDTELFADNDARPLLRYLPATPLVVLADDVTESSCHRTGSGKGRRSKQSVCTSAEIECVPRESIFDSMLSGPQPIVTVLVIRPEAVKRNFAAILRRVMQEGFQVVGLRYDALSPSVASQLALDDSFVRPNFCVLLALLRENAVKRLLDVIQSADAVDDGIWRAIFGRERASKFLYCSKSHASAVADTKLLFPDGLCCCDVPALFSEQVTCPAVDCEIDVHHKKTRELDVRQRHHHQSDVLMTTVNSIPGAVSQSNCVLLTPPLIHTAKHRSRIAPFVEVIDHLTRAGFEVIGCRMVWLTTAQAEHLDAICRCPGDMGPRLTSGPSIVLALQKESAIIAFDSHLGSEFDKQSIISRYGSDILRPHDTNQAASMLTFFFSELSPASCVQLIDLSPMEP